MDETVSEQQTLHAWLILVRAGLPSGLCHKLLFSLAGPEQIVEADKATLLNRGLRSEAITRLHNPDRRVIEMDLKWLENPGHSFISCMDKRYPRLLKHIADPPIGLFVRGNADVLDSLQLAIVGTRKPTPGGRRAASELAGQLATSGLLITSGLALGIDSSAHRAALSAGGRSIAVLGNGLDTTYPYSNRELANEIASTGAVISEYPVSVPPRRGNFPMRNRIISGMTIGTLIIEAAIKSGSLITARLALEQGREVFAVPGSIYNPMALGCHALISQGARLTAGSSDVLEEFSYLKSHLEGLPRLRTPCPGINERLDVQAKLLLDNIGYESVSIDELVEATGLKASEISVSILEMELNNLVVSLPGGRFARK